MDIARITINENHSGTITRTPARAALLASRPEWAMESAGVFLDMSAAAVDILLGLRLYRYTGPWPLVRNLFEEEELRFDIDGPGQVLYYDEG